MFPYGTYAFAAYRNKHLTCNALFNFFNSIDKFAYRLLVGKPEGRRLLGRPRCRCMDNNRMDLGEVE
jgi:hypothetical protein